MTRVDVHQHRWSAELVAVLAARDTPPRMREREDGWWLEIDGEPDSRIDVAGDDLGTRRALLADDGVDRALIAHSPALAIDALPAAEARAIADAHAAGNADLGDDFGWWAALPLREARASDVDAAIDAGAVGVTLPAGALATPAHVEHLQPLLERLAERGAPAFVHPGPDPFGAPRDPQESTSGRQSVKKSTSARFGEAADVPGWWPALADYVPTMHVAWHAFAATGRPAHPELRVLWAMLAGLAPLHRERLAVRGGPSVHDPLSFYDTSSYGAQAQQGMVDAVGLEQLVHGSDRPVVAPPPAPGPLGPDAWDALTRANPRRLGVA